jgi:predicted restriction endonuclease
MKGVEWGMLYKDFGDVNLNPNIVEDEVRTLMMDEDVTKKAGVYPYLLSRQERYLSIRAFTDNMKREAYERQNHQCPHCLGEGIAKEWRLEEMEGDHITPWSQGGRTIADNCQMLCKAHNRLKSGR